MKRERAVELVQHVLRNLDAGCGEWPLSLVTRLYVFGSFARGVLTPHDVDLVVERNNQDDRWLSHFVTSLSYGRDPYAVIRRELTTGMRGCQFVFETNQLEEFNALLIWERGDNLITAMGRLAAIQPDENAGRAPRDATLPEFEGLDDWIPRPDREVLSRAVNEGTIRLERIVLQDGAQVDSEEAVMHARQRWMSSSPLYRAAMAMLAYWESQGIDPGHCHLHGTDIRDRDTPYFAGFGLRYFRSIPHCLTEFHRAEWVEVVHPTRTKLLDGAADPAAQCVPSGTRGLVIASAALIGYRDQLVSTGQREQESIEPRDCIRERVNVSPAPLRQRRRRRPQPVQSTT